MLYSVALMSVSDHNNKKKKENIIKTSKHPKYCILSKTHFTVVFKQAESLQVKVN